MRTYPPCWVLKARIQKHWGKPLLFYDKCPGFFYVHYTTHGTCSFTSHPKDEAIMVKCLAQGLKQHDQPCRDSNPHSDNTRTWVQCTRPLGHDTPCMSLEWFHVIKFSANVSGVCSLFINYSYLLGRVCSLLYSLFVQFCIQLRFFMHKYILVYNVHVLLV